MFPGICGTAGYLGNMRYLDVFT